MEVLQYCRIDSPVGPLMLAASERALVLLQFGDHPFPPRDRKFAEISWTESPAELRQYARELAEYFAGQRRQFTFELDLRGTAFQRRCWQALLEIPYGETRTYAHVAGAVGCPRGFRAVGMANHDNPIAIVVPCHRVLASDGTLGGYGGGLATKQKLLEMEGVDLNRRAADEAPPRLFAKQSA